MTLKVVSLFSGIGGMDLGLEATGHFKTILFSENNKFCQKILSKHWPDVPIIEDVRSINGKEIKEADVLVGGFPCQPWSVAGKRKGKDDSRHLWPEMFRIIKEAKPSIVIGENVPGIINTQMALGQCVLDLESEGYEVQPIVLPACSVNAPHRRYRVFIIAMVNSDNIRFKQHNETKKEEQVGRTETPIVSGGSFMENSRRSEWWQQSSGNTESVGQGTFEETKWSANSNSIGRPSERTEAMADSLSRNVEAGRERQRQICKGYQREGIPDNASSGSEIEGFTDNWSVEPNVGRLANGVSDRVAKLKALGNAVVPQLTYIIGMSIIKAINKEK